MNHLNEISGHILDSAIKVHRSLGPGLLESVYERALAHELKKRGLKVDVQIPVTFTDDDIVFDEGFRADLIVDDSVIVELKSVDALKDLHKKQLLTYLRLSGHKLGLLINFNEVLLKDGLTRVANGTPD